MLIFFWVLGALGVAYAASRSGRNAGWWFILSIALTPLTGALGLKLANRWFSASRSG
jgi:hypothetical protein